MSMSRRSTTKIRRSAVLVALLLATASVTTGEAHFWSRFWGNLENAQENEQDIIIARRAGIVFVGGLGVAALAYALWKIPTTKKFLKNLCADKNHNPTIEEIPAQPQQGDNAPRISECRTVTVPSVQQGRGSAECGLYALCNAYAIEQCVENNQPVTNQTAQNNCRQAYRRFQQADLGYHRDLVSEQIEQARDVVFGDLLTGNNCALLGVRANAEVHGASPETETVIENLANGHINSAHFVTNTGGHWVLLSVVRTDNLYIIYHMDSAGNGTPGRSAHCAIGYLTQQLISAPNQRA